MLARAIDSQGHIAATAIDLVRAETMMAIYKSELRSQGRSDEEIAMAAAAGLLRTHRCGDWVGTPWRPGSSDTVSVYRKMAATTD